MKKESGQAGLREQLLYYLRGIDPLELFLMLLHVSGVVLLIYALMQLIHGIEGKDGVFLKRGLLFLGIAAVLLLIRPLAHALLL